MRTPGKIEVKEVGRVRFRAAPEPLWQVDARNEKIDVGNDQASGLAPSATPALVLLVLVRMATDLPRDIPDIHDIQTRLGATLSK